MSESTTAGSAVVTRSYVHWLPGHVIDRLQWSRLSLSTVVTSRRVHSRRSATVAQVDMTTVVGLTTADPFEPCAASTGDRLGGGAGKCGVRSIRCEPTPVPTAGEKMRSSSSLGSKSGCLRLDRDPLGIWCFCCYVCLYSISLKKLQQRSSCCFVVLKRFRPAGPSPRAFCGHELPCQCSGQSVSH